MVVILALQSSDAVHVGVDNLGVVRHVGRLLDDGYCSLPFELVTDGDLLVLIRRMLDLRGRDTVCITKVKGHADEGMVMGCRVRELDTLGNNTADEAADFGRRRVGPAVVDARRNLSGVCGRWCPAIIDLHRLFIAISRAVVNHDGRMVLLLILWYGLLVLIPRGVVWFMRFGTRPFCLGRLVFWIPSGLLFLHLLFALRTLLNALYILVSWLSGSPFLGSLHWPAGGLDLGVGGVSYVELLILYLLWAGEKLTLEKAHPRYLRPGRPISVSAVPFGPGIDIWRSCRFIGAMMRSLSMLPGGLGGFVPCSIGAKHCRIRHVGWEGCSHGLTSRLRESASGTFLDQLLLLFQYPPGSSRALLAGTLPLRYCSTRFVRKVPFWTLPVPGHVAGLIAAEVQVAQVDEVEVARREIHWVSGSGPGRK